MPWSIFTDGGGDATAVAWAKQLLQQIGAPVTPGNVEFIYQWEKAEGGGGKYNPLNQGPVPGHPELTTTGSQYGGGAADYASWQAGLMGASDYLHMGYYTNVLSNLMSNNPGAARAALWASPWAASHYGYGANWPNVPLPGNTSSTLPNFSDGTPSPTTNADTSVSASTDDTCLIGSSGTPKINLPQILPFERKSIGGSSGTCYLSKTAMRAFLGALILTAGGAITLIGVASLLKYGAQKSGAITVISQVPVVGRVARKAA